MTGFGRGTAKRKETHYVVEVRSVNSRYCEVHILAPRGFLELESDLASMVRKRFARGKFDLALKLERRHRTKSMSEGDDAIVQRWKQLEKIRKRLGIHEPTPLMAALGNLPTNGEQAAESNSAPLFLQAASDALKKLEKHRRQEGTTLASDIARRASSVIKAVDRIAVRLTDHRQERVEELRRRVADLSEQVGVDRGRLEAEIALLADRFDITEEIVRLQSHLKRLGQLLHEGGSVGRSIDFLIQEMNREINTIGSKSADLNVSDDVLFIKSEIEKIREQAQNLE